MTGHIIRKDPSNAAACEHMRKVLHIFFKLNTDFGMSKYTLYIVKQIYLGLKIYFIQVGELIEELKEAFSPKW